MYYWWNDAVFYWALSFILVSSGIVVTRYTSKEEMKALVSVGFSHTQIYSAIY
jgi:hypothetical protein